MKIKLQIEDKLKKSSNISANFEINDYSMDSI